MNESTKWCYSTDGESFAGQFATQDAAASEAEEQLRNNVEPGQVGTYAVGEIAAAERFLNAYRLGAAVEEMVEERLSDDIWCDDHIIKLSDTEKTELGQLVIDYIKARQGFRAWGVKNVRECTYTVPESGGA